MDPAKGEIAHRVFGVCRRVISPFLAAPSKAVKAFNSISKAHIDWDEKNLKIAFKTAPPTPLLVSDDDDSQPRTPNITTAKRGSRKRNPPRGVDDDNSTPCKKQKEGLDAPQESTTPDEAEILELKVGTPNSIDSDNSSNPGGT